MALFGGSFDPPHCGHAAVARAAAKRFALHRVLLAPTALQPLKPGGAVAAYADRLAMVALLCRDLNLEAEAREVFEASEVERAEGGRAVYTIDTLRQLKAEMMPGEVLFNVVGVDAFLDLRRWREPEALLAAAEWIVVSRPGVELDFEALKLTASERARVHVLDGVAVPVSATDIRARLSAGDRCADVLPATVAEYVAEHQLYRR